MFNRPPSPLNSKSVNIIFFVSTDYRNNNRKAVVGFYGFPIFGQEFERTSNHKLYKTYNSGNVKALPENIIYFDNPIVISNESVKAQSLLPVGKKISQQGFNYLNSDNVQNLLQLAVDLNPINKKLKSYVSKFPLLVKRRKEIEYMEDFCEAVGDNNADTLKGIIELEKRMQNQQPEVKKRISSYIERGVIANKIKKITGYKCLICLGLELPPYSFLKTNGDYYVESHHVDQVSTMKKGVLSVSNLITVCANHHRQLHYGNARLIKQDAKSFTFSVDEHRITISKIQVDI